MDSIEKIAKTVDEAVSAAMKALECDNIEDVEVTVLEQPTKGFIGLIGVKPAKVLVKKKFNPVNTVKVFLREIAASMGLVLDIEAELKDRQLYINIKSQDIGILIGKRGQTLDSLQYLVNLVVNKGNAPYISVTLDTENYRQRRRETLESLAYNLAKKAKMTHKDVVLEPMNPYERRIIHSVLQNDRYVTTYSEGEEPYRNIVISPKH